MPLRKWEGSTRRLTRKPGDRPFRTTTKAHQLRREVVVKRLSAFLACFFLTPLFAFAQSSVQPKVTDEIVVTASAVPETVSSTPASVTVVTKKEIDEQNARDIADVLREVPGLSLSRSGSNGKATSVFSRGANSQHTLVLWNGIQIKDPYFSGLARGGL